MGTGDAYLALQCVICRQRHATADDPQRYADVMYGYYTALHQGTGGAEPEHAAEVAQARRDQQVRRSFVQWAGLYSRNALP